MTDTDKHIMTLRLMLRDEKAILRKLPSAWGTKRRIAALQWAIEQNAYGVTSDEVVG